MSRHKCFEDFENHFCFVFALTRNCNFNFPHVLIYLCPCIGKPESTIKVQNEGDLRSCFYEQVLISIFMGKSSCYS